MKKQLLITSIAICGIVQTVPFLANAQSIAAGSDYCLAVCTTNTVMAWGMNSYGQFGNGNVTSSNVPVPAASSLAGITAVAAGAYHALALKNDGTVWAWGGNGYGQLGYGTNTNIDIPVQVSSLTGVIAIAAGKYHSLAVKNDGTVWTWGN